MNISRIVVSMAALGLLTGCYSSAKNHGKSSVTASYRLPTLSVTLPESARVPAIITAAEQTVRARGYSVESSAATEETGKLVVRPPRTGDYPKIVIESRVEHHATIVTLTVWPLGDEELARSVLDGTLQRLGL